MYGLECNDSGKFQMPKTLPTRPPTVLPSAGADSQMFSASAPQVTNATNECGNNTPTEVNLNVVLIVIIVGVALLLVGIAFVVGFVSGQPSKRGLTTH